MYKVLIVDDNIIDLESIHEMIDWNSLNVDEVFLASTGKEGFEKAVSLKPDLIISDILMPEWDGLTMVSKIREVILDVKVIFMSCFDEFKYVKTAISLNAYAYVMKPIDLDELINEISKSLDVVAKDNSQIELMLDLQKQVSENKDYVQREVLMDIIHNVLPKNDIDKIANKVEIYIKKYCFAVHCQFNYDEIIQDIEQQYVVINNTKKSIENNQKGCRTYGFIQKSDSMLVVVYIDDVTNEEDAYSIIFSILEQCIEDTHKFFGIHMRVYTGPVLSDIKELHSTVMLLEQAVANNMYSQSSNIILVQNEFTHDINLEFLQNGISKIIQNEKIDSIDDFVSSYLDNNSQITYSKSFCFSVISIVSVYLLERNCNFEEIFGDTFCVWKKVIEFDASFNVRQWVKNVLTETIKYIAADKKSKYKELVKQIKNIVNKEYATINNVNEIADRLFISSNYMTYLFKKYTGETVFDYMLNIRMEKAKNLLKDTNIKVYAIAESIGYKSKTYFTAAFKEYTGMTPKDFRESIT